MSITSAIQWTDATWNIARGCTKVDEDCKYCYMYRDSMNGTRYQPLEVVRTKTVFNLPLKLKESSKIFTCSLTDFFHESIDSYRHEAWEIIRKCPQHTFQILTKRPERIADHLPEDWGEGWKNVWLGTSIGSPKGYRRVVDLSLIKTKVRFLSIEPLWQKVDLWYPQEIYGNDGPKFCCNGIDCGCCGMPVDPPLIQDYHWLIVGGESGNDTGKYKYRPCEIDWIESVIETGISLSIPVFVKQMGTYLAKQMGLKDRHGGDINEWPEYLRIRQFPRN